MQANKQKRRIIMESKYKWNLQEIFETQEKLEDEIY